MPIVYAAVLPHGALVLQPEDTISQKLQEGMIKVAEELEKLKPDLIFLSTPHGLMLQDHFAFYHAQKAKGTAEWQGEYKGFAIELELDVERTEDLARLLGAEMIIPHVPIFPIEIAWGEVIPLYYIYQRINPPSIILSHPARRYDHPERMEQELYILGKKIHDYFIDKDLRVAVIISGDWAHTHNDEGPYGYSETAAPFDEHIEGWLRTLHLKNEDWQNHRKKAAELVNTALSCGYTGLMLLDGIIQGNWKGEFHAFGAPSYYGMAVASYWPST